MSTVTRVLRAIARSAVVLVQDLAAAPDAGRGPVLAAGPRGAGSRASEAGARP